jgi:hypothetical protein
VPLLRLSVPTARLAGHGGPGAAVPVCLFVAWAKTRLGFGGANNGDASSATHLPGAPSFNPTKLLRHRQILGTCPALEASKASDDGS